jgi:hypothetical protein
MAMTISSAFEQFRRNLEITDLQTETVSTRQTGVRDVLKNGMTVVEDSLTGSYARSTMIAPLKEADIDVFAVLDPSYYAFYNGQNGGPAGLLDWVKRTLRKTYTLTPDISRNGQAVTIRLLAAHQCTIGRRLFTRARSSLTSSDKSSYCRDWAMASTAR